MTDLEIIEKLATEFFGWRLGDSVRDRKVWITKRDERPISIPLDDFDPLHDPAACALVLDELERRGWCWEWRRDPIPEVRRYDFVIVGHDHPGYAVSMDNRYRAVCLAVLAAIGD